MHIHAEKAYKQTPMANVVPLAPRPAGGSPDDRTIPTAASRLPAASNVGSRIAHTTRPAARAVGSGNAAMAHASPVKA